MYPRIKVAVPFWSKGIGGTGGVVPAALSLVTKLRGWYALESDREDGWGAYPMVVPSGSPGPFVAASTYGTGMSGNALVSSAARTNEVIPNYGTGTSFFIGAFRSTSTFTNDQLTAFMGKSAFNDSLSLSESATGFRSRGVLDSAGPAVYAADTVDSVDTWTLTVAQHLATGAVRNHKNITFNAASSSGNVNLNPTAFISMGTVAGTASGAAVALMFWGEGELSVDELVYLYNGGSGRTIAEIIADSSYTRPTCRFTQDLFSEFGYGVPAISYSGTIVAHKNTDGVSNFTYTNTGKTVGKHVFACKINQALAGVSSYIGPRGGPEGAAGFAYLNLTNASTLVASSGIFTAGTAPGLSVTAAGDVYMFAIDFTNLKVWVGKNGTWSGDPVAGTNPAWTFTAGHEFFAWVQENDAQFGAEFYFTADTYPYTPPTGFSLWGA